MSRINDQIVECLGDKDAMFIRQWLKSVYENRRMDVIPVVYGIEEDLDCFVKLFTAAFTDRDFGYMTNLDDLGSMTHMSYYKRRKMTLVYGNGIDRHERKRTLCANIVKMMQTWNYCQPVIIANVAHVECLHNKHLKSVARYIRPNKELGEIDRCELQEWIKSATGGVCPSNIKDLKL